MHHVPCEKMRFANPVQLMRQQNVHKANFTWQITCWCFALIDIIQYTLWFPAARVWSKIRPPDCTVKQP